MSPGGKDASMRSMTTAPRGRGGRVLVPLIALIAVAAAATLVTLLLLGAARDGLPGLGARSGPAGGAAAPARGAPTRIELQPGQVLAPVPVETVPAFTALRDEHFIRIGPNNDLSLSQRAVNADAKPDVITDPRMLIGRVLRFDKSAGYPIGESDLLPPGTRPGIVAGVPIGKRAMIVDADRLEGARALNRGDRFDLIAALTPEKRRRVLGSAARPAPPAPSAAVTELPGATVAEPEVETPATELLLIAEGGTVIRPVSVRDVPRGTRSAAGVPLQTEVREEFTIAIAPEEVVRLTRALAEGAQIILVARTGLPGESDELAGRIEIFDEAATEEPAPAPRRTLETLRGADREIVVIPPRP